MQVRHPTIIGPLTIYSTSSAFKDDTGLKIELSGISIAVYSTSHGDEFYSPSLFNPETPIQVHEDPIAPTYWNTTELASQKTTSASARPYYAKHYACVTDAVSESTSSVDDATSPESPCRSVEDESDPEADDETVRKIRKAPTTFNSSNSSWSSVRGTKRSLGAEDSDGKGKRLCSVKVGDT